MGRELDVNTVLKNTFKDERWGEEQVICCTWGDTFWIATIESEIRVHCLVHCAVNISAAPKIRGDEISIFPQLPVGNELAPNRGRDLKRTEHTWVCEPMGRLLVFLHMLVVFHHPFQDFIEMVPADVVP